MIQIGNTILYSYWAGEGNGNPLQYSSWEISWTENSGKLQSRRSLRVGHDLLNKHTHIHIGIPRWLSCKESAYQFRSHRRHRLNPWVWKILWRRKWQPTPVLFLEALTEKLGRLQSRWVTQSLAQLSMCIFFIHTSNVWWASQVVLVAKNLPTNAGDITDAGLIPGLGGSPGGGHITLLQYSCLENPKDRGAWWPTVHGVSNS